MNPYVRKRIAQIQAEVGTRKPGPKPMKPVYTDKSEPPTCPPPSPQEIDPVGHLYVRQVRARMQEREATWFDVALAYSQGLIDAAKAKEWDTDTKNPSQGGA